jgi:hypothetical protein
VDDEGCDGGEEEIPAPSADGVEGVDWPDYTVIVRVEVGDVLLEDCFVAVLLGPFSGCAVGGFICWGGVRAGGSWVNEAAFCRWGEWETLDLVTRRSVLLGVSSGMEMTYGHWTLL